MRYLIDTNICIHYFKGQFRLKERIENLGYDRLAISEISLAELIYGAHKSQKVEKNLKIIEVFSKRIEIFPIFPSFHIYGKEKARLKSIGKPISDFDLLIGCTAILNNMVMVTRNIKEFERLESIIIENWID